MPLIETCIYDIAFDDLQGAEEYALGVLQMDKETVMDQFDDVYELTLGRCRETFDCKALCTSFPIEGNDGDSIALAGGHVLSSPLLARVLAHAEELALYAATIHGYEELANDPDKDMFDGMFYNAWGAGYSMAANAWTQQRLREKAQQAGCFIGRSWSPGEGDLEMRLQKDIAALLDLGQIGVALENVAPRPVMTVMGFMGISTKAAIEQDGDDIARSTMV